MTEPGYVAVSVCTQVQHITDRSQLSLSSPKRATQNTSGNNVDFTKDFFKEPTEGRNFTSPNSQQTVEQVFRASCSPKFLELSVIWPSSHILPMSFSLLLSKSIPIRTLHSPMLYLILVLLIYSGQFNSALWDDRQNRGPPRLPPPTPPVKSVSSP